MRNDDSGQKTYSEKLKDPRWQRRRLEIFQRDDFTCRACGSTTKTLHVHHHWYESNKEPWEVPDACLVTLCFECHEYQESHKGDAATCIMHLNSAGFMNSDLVIFGHIVRCLSDHIPVQQIHLILLKLDRDEEFRNNVLEFYNKRDEELREKYNLPY